MTRKPAALLLLTLVVAGLGLGAQTASAQTADDLALEDQPGYFPLEHLDLLSEQEVSLEINLRGAMLKMISALTGAEDPGFARLVAGLEAVHVRSGEVDPAHADAVRNRVAAGQQWLADNGWLALLRVQEEGEEVYVYTREQGGDIVGMAILALDAGEATAINLVGRISPDQIGRLAAGFSISGLEHVQERIDTEEDEQ